MMMNLDAAQQESEDDENTNDGTNHPQNMHNPTSPAPPEVVAELVV